MHISVGLGINKSPTLSVGAPSGAQWDAKTFTMECAPKAASTNSITLIPTLNADKAIKSKLLKAINHRGHGGTQRKAKGYVALVSARYK